MLPLPDRSLVAPTYRFAEALLSMAFAGAIFAGWTLSVSLAATGRVTA
jgi:hypothetical protein